MSEKKIKIKELACELKVSNPDMLKAALDEGISARNSASAPRRKGPGLPRRRPGPIC